MRSVALPLLLAGSLGTMPASLPAQSLAERVGRAASGTARFQYPATPDVCGVDGTIVRFHDGTPGYSFTHHRGAADALRHLSADELRERCRFGPAFVDLRIHDGRVEHLDLRVGTPAPGPAADLGAVSAADAVAFLLGPAARTASRSSDPLFAATIADTDWAPAMLALATDRSAPAESRRNAIFWTSQAAGEKAARGLHSILRDDSEELELRKHAVFALSQHRSDQAVTALLDVAERSPEPALRKAAFFWLGQKHEDPRVLALFNRVLLDR